MPIGERPMFDLQRETRRGWRVNEFRETGWYPEMVWWFKQKYNPREESVRGFLERRKPSHVRFLKKRGWNEESINLAWTEILSACAHKHVRFAAAVESLRATDRRRRYKIDGRYVRH